MTARFLVVTSNNFMTDVGQKTDLFESHKVFGEFFITKAVYNDDVPATLERAGQSISAIVQSIEATKKHKAVLVHLIDIEHHDMIMLNRSLTIPYYRNENIKVISDGQKWFVLDDLINLMIRVKTK